MTTPAQLYTPDRVIRDAMYNVKLLQEGSDPSSEQYARFLVRLQDLINFEITQGLKMFLYQDVGISLTVGQALYTFGPTGTTVMPRPLAVTNAYYLDPTAVQRPLISMSWNEYVNLGNVSQLGAVNSYFVDRQGYIMNIKLWPVPDVTQTGTVHFVFRTSPAALVNVTDTISFAPEWFMYLHWALASEIGVGQPQALTDNAKSMREFYRDALSGQDVEHSSTYMQPDPRMPGSRFTARRG